MKRLALGFAGALLLLGAVVVGNALRGSASPRRAAQVPGADGVDAAVIAAHLAEALRFQTISHQDPKDDDQQALASFRGWMETTWPKTHAALSREVINGAGLLYRWEGTDPSLLPVLFLAHQDVVPVEPGTEKAWTQPPFDGVIADGFVWGRGAFDDKGSLVCLLEAVESLVAQGVRPKRSVWLAFGFDEEVGGHGGAAKLAEELAKRKVRFEWALDEGSAVTQGIVPGVTRPVAAVAVSEKGYLSLELVAHAEGGHSSMPPPQTAVGRLASALDRLQRDPFPARLTPVVQENFGVLAPELGFGQRLVLSNLWLFSSLVERSLGKNPVTNPLVRTTTAPTILEAGVKENVLPSTARGVVNFRILPGESVESVTARVKAVVGDEQVTVTKLDRIVSEPAPFSSTTGPGFQLIAEATRASFSDVIVVPSTVNGATDGRHYQQVAKDVYRFVPRLLVTEDLQRVHGTNERADVAGLAVAVRAYRFLMTGGEVKVGAAKE